MKMPLTASAHASRLPLMAAFLAFLLLCASLAYWGMQVFRPQERPVAAPPAARMEAPLESAAALFGGHSAGGAAVASNYQLKGIVMAHDARDSAAVLGVDGRPAQALRVGDEVAPGVKVKEVNQDYVLIDEGGVSKRVDLPAELKSAASAGIGMPPPAPPASQPYVPPPPQQMPQAMPGEAVNPAMQMAPGGPQPQAPNPVTAPAAPNAISAPPRPN